MLLRHPEFTPAELAQFLKWPLEKVREALDECERLSLIRCSPEDNTRILLVGPEVGLQALLVRRESEFQRRQQEIAESRVEVSRLIDEYAAAQEERRRTDVERLVGIDEIRCRIEELANECEHTMMSFHPGGGLTSSHRSASRPVNELMLERGVEMRTVYLDSIYNDPASVDHARGLAERGAHVRTTAMLPPRMLIYDRARAVIPIDPEVSAAGALVFRGPGIMATLCNLFEQVWEKAAPISGGRPHRRETEHGELSGQEQTVLQLLGEGYTDEVVARKLGVSVRTCRRITADLMARLGARSRFQAGLRAVELGWLGSRQDADLGHV
ncbi:LuxR C-terminal-related transcriptional regulator [Streptomyces sp. AP-93]|uniref:helix-turn-helix transcriptional regulator n=1 Tax=Streptomyces sp. AP-93 TaxID=2929048 RepID=UPI001FAF52D8|nr:LuxR C-terminal-related transcriptional regulator [Streptomyces sp. AP-93]MCJ0871740.1 LuxR C-terminal-related transcriptional regulator [Streptomyces sp. AP-93]